MRIASNLYDALADAVTSRPALSRVLTVLAAAFAGIVLGVAVAASMSY